MDDSDRGLEALRRSVERVGQGVEAPDAARLESAVRRGRRRRRVRIGVGLVAGLTLAAGVALPLHALLPLGHAAGEPVGTGTPNRPSSSFSPRAPVHAGWVTYQLPAEGVSIQAPPDWNLVQDPIPGLSHPTALFELASYYAPAAPSGGCAPTDAVAKLPDSQVLFWLNEYKAPPDTVSFPPRANPFPLENLAYYECFGGRRGYLTRFFDQGRYFQVHIVFGPNVSDVLRQHVIDSLGSLQVDPAGAAGPGPGAGATWLAPPTFSPAPGWQTESSSADGDSLTPHTSPLTWASNVPFAQADLDTLAGDVLTGNDWPRHTIASLSSGGVVMVADLAVPGYTAPMDGATFPTRPLPLDVHDMIGPVEGDKQFVLTAAVNGQFVEVRFVFGSDTPTDAQLQAAQQELIRLVVPSLPPAG